MRFYGAVGYGVTSEDENHPGVWTESIVEKMYKGDISKNAKRNEISGVNDDITISNTISIVSDPFATQNYMSIKYITWMGTKWKVNSVEIEPPRLILSVGGVYNG